MDLVAVFWFQAIKYHQMFGNFLFLVLIWSKFGMQNFKNYFHYY